MNPKNNVGQASWPVHARVGQALPPANPANWRFHRSSFLVVLLLAAPLFAAAPTVDIKVDQVGYLPTAPKVALVAPKTAAAEFTVRRAGDGGVALRGTLAAPVEDPDSGDRVQAADFSKLTTAGKYYVEIPDVGRSWEFAIGPDVYGRAWYLAMRSYYG